MSTHKKILYFKQANKFNGSNVQIVQQTLTQPFDLQIIHPKRQPMYKGNNLCAVNNGGCSDLCLLSYNQTIGCRCPHRKRLDSDNKTCIGKSYLLWYYLYLPILPTQNIFWVYLRNEFNFWNVHGIMNTSGLLQSKWSPKPWTDQNLNLLLIFTFSYKYLKYKNYF